MIIQLKKILKYTCGGVPELVRSCTVKWKLSKTVHSNVDVYQKLYMVININICW